MDAPRALFNAMAWLIGRHNQGFHVADLEVATWLDKAVGVVLVGMGLTSVSQTASEESPLKRFPNGYVYDTTPTPTALGYRGRAIVSRAAATSADIERLMGTAGDRGLRWACVAIRGGAIPVPTRSRPGRHVAASWPRGIPRAAAKGKLHPDETQGLASYGYVEVGKALRAGRVRRMPAPPGAIGHRQRPGGQPMRGPKVPPMRG
jgi:hypothetical protein